MYIAFISDRRETNLFSTRWCTDGRDSSVSQPDGACRNTSLVAIHLLLLWIVIDTSPCLLRYCVCTMTYARSLALASWRVITKLVGRGFGVDNCLTKCPVTAGTAFQLDASLRQD